MSTNGTLAPFSQEAEEATIGSILVNPETLFLIASFLKAEDFYILRHTYIWEAFIRLHQRGDQIDYVTVRDELRAAQHLDDIGGPGYLLHLINSTPNSQNAEVYARLVERAAIRHRLLIAADQIKRWATNEALPIEKVTGDSEACLFAVTERRLSAQMIRVSDAIDNHFQTIEERFANPSDLRGLPSSSHKINDILHGYQHSRLYVGAGRPGMGKSSWIMTEIAHLCALGRKIALFTLEMPIEEVMDSLTAIETGIAVEKLTSGKLLQAEYSRYTEASGKITHWNLWINDQGDLSPLELRAHCRRLAHERGIDMVFIDYLQLMGGGESERFGNRDQEVGYVSRSLKALAKELHCPVFAAAQINRQVEYRADKRPVLSDLRESGNIEADADCVMFFYREDYYDRPEVPNVVSPTEIIVAKHRGGATGFVKEGFHSALKKFVPLAQETRIP